MVSRILLLLFALSLTLPAHAAEWRRAESEHYVVHAALDEDELRHVVQTMEDFGRVLDIVLPGQTEPGRKPQFYLVPDAQRVSDVYGLLVSGAPAVGAETWTVLTVYDLDRPKEDRFKDVFFYLGAHHIAAKFFKPHTPWSRSGLATFLSMTYRDEQGDFIIGRPDPVVARSGGVSAADVTRVVTTPATPESQNDFDRFYEHSAALAAPLIIDPAQNGVLSRYLDAYASGASMEETARALGDPVALSQELSRRRKARRLPMRRVTLTPQPTSMIDLRAMRPDEIALVDLRIERLLEKRREAVAGRLDDLTAKFPDSAPVWYEYAAAEYARVLHGDFGETPPLRGFGFAGGELIVTSNPHSDAEAWRAVNRALALDPAMAAAQRLRAEILLHRLVRTGDTADEAAYDEVRRALAPLAWTSAAHPLAAALYHQTFIEQGRPAPEDALAQLAVAYRTNAAVPELRYAYAAALSRAGQTAEARRLLTALLNDPRYAPAAERALGPAR